MKRSGPPRRKTPLRSKRATPRRQRVDLDQTAAEAYAECHSRPGCEADIPGICTGYNQHAHHRRLAKQGGPTTTANLLAVCLRCHDWIHHHPEAANTLGLILRTGQAITPYNRFTCLDCGADTSRRGVCEYYTLDRALWKSITVATRGAGMLCIGCVETRLGRELDAADFDLAAPINGLDWSEKSPRLRDRLSRR